MVTRSSYEHGEFCWVELNTTDARSAKQFYSELFGWTFHDEPVGPGMVYSTCLLNGKSVGALFEMTSDMARNLPPHWAPYLNVTDVDAVVARALRHGGQLVREPMDVMDAGRMAILFDPAGAMFWVWQANKHTGAQAFRDPGSLTWVELYTTDPAAAGRFYVETVGWTMEPVDMGPMGMYTLFKLPGHEETKGGMMQIGPHMQGVPSHWLSYFEVQDCDVSVGRVIELGGTVQLPPTDIPNIGRFALVQDPQGASFALYKNAH